MRQETFWTGFVVEIPVACRDPRRAVQLGERTREARDDRLQVVRHRGGGICYCGLVLRLLRFGERCWELRERLPVDHRGVGDGCGRGCRPFSSGQNRGESGLRREDNGQEKCVAAGHHSENSFKRSRGQDLEPYCSSVVDP